MFNIALYLYQIKTTVFKIRKNIEAIKTSLREKSRTWIVFFEIAFQYLKQMFHKLTSDLISNLSDWITCNSKRPRFLLLSSQLQSVKKMANQGVLSPPIVIF